MNAFLSKGLKILIVILYVSTLGLLLLLVAVGLMIFLGPVDALYKTIVAATNAVGLLPLLWVPSLDATAWFLARKVKLGDSWKRATRLLLLLGVLVLVLGGRLILFSLTCKADLC